MIDYSKPWMAPEEIALVTEVLEDKVMNKTGRAKVRVWEWGAGGSTVYFPNAIDGISDWYSVEHNPKVYNAIKGEVSDNVGLILSDVNHYNAAPGSAEKFDDYISAIKELGTTKVDVVIIDGRCRVECAKAALPHLKSGAIVLMHDAFNKDFVNPKTGWRRNYADVLEWYDEVARVDSTQQTLVALSAK